MSNEISQQLNTLSLQDLKTAVQDQADRRKVLVEFAAKQLSKEAGDYNEIKGRKSLGKPGAEKFCSLFGVTIGEPELAQDIMETLPISMRESGAVVLKTKLYRDGQYLGSGIGARTLKQDSQDLNKMMKMARKSSVVDAVISTFGLSDLFTQDIEDMPQFNPSISPVLPKVKSVGDLEFTVLDITIKTSTNKRTYAELTIDTEEGEATALTSTELSDYLRTDGIHYWAEGKWGTRNGKRNFLITSTKDTIQRKHEDDSWQIGI